jgi:protein TonB
MAENQKIINISNAPDFDELVFENKNKKYGAYSLRRLYPKNMGKGFGFSLLLFVLLVSIPAISAWISNLKEQFAIEQNVEVNLVEPPPLDEDQPPPPPPPPDPPPPVQETIKFTPPVITEEPIDDKDIPPPQEELNETNVGKTTQEGSGDIIDLPDGDGNAIIDEAPQEIFTVVEQPPEFPGGEEKLFQYLQKNIKYPAEAKEAGIQGTVFVTFVVETDGVISNVKILRGQGGGLDNEAMRVVKGMPSWKAGKQNGRGVRVQFNLPIKFTLR